MAGYNDAELALDARQGLIPNLHQVRGFRRRRTVSEHSDAGISIVLEVFGVVKENCPEQRDQRSARWYAVSVPAMKSAEILKRWMAAINGHDVGALTALMAADHGFVDSLGNRVNGAKSMEAGWRGYFAMCPDSGFAETM